MKKIIKKGCCGLLAFGVLLGASSEAFAQMTEQRASNVTPQERDVLEQFKHDLHPYRQNDREPVLVKYDMGETSGYFVRRDNESYPHFRQRVVTYFKTLMRNKDPSKLNWRIMTVRKDGPMQSEEARVKAARDMEIMHQKRSGM